MVYCPSGWVRVTPTRSMGWTESPRGVPNQVGARTARPMRLLATAASPTS